MSPKRIIFFHGVGGTGASLRPLGERIASELDMFFPDGPQAFEMGSGRQWFSVKGVTEADRPERVERALPTFTRMIEDLGHPSDSLLVGFSQGAIMALHAVAAGMPAAGVLALSGRLAGPVAARTEWPPIALLHGSADPVMPADVALATKAWLLSAGAAPHLQLFDGLGHGIDDRVLAAIRQFIADM